VKFDPQRRSSTSLALFVSCLVALLALGACSSDSTGFEVDDGSFTEDQAQEVEAFLGAPLPNSAVPDQTRAEMTSGGRYDALSLRLTLPADEVTPFLTSIGVDEPLREGRLCSAPSDSHPEWFQTGELENFSGGDILAEKAIEVTVDLSEPSMSTVYLSVIELLIFEIDKTVN